MNERREAPEPQPRPEPPREKEILIPVVREVRVNKTGVVSEPKRG